MIGIIWPDMLEKQASFDLIIGVPEEEAQYFLLHLPPDGQPVYCRDTTPEEKEILSDPLYIQKMSEANLK
jgi:hypothetical protein